MTKLKGIMASLLLMGVTFADEIESMGQSGFVEYSISFSEILTKWGVALGWIFIASIGFAMGVGISLKVFDWSTSNIDEWEEVKKGNLGVVAILVTLIIMIGAIILKII